LDEPTAGQSVARTGVSELHVYGPILRILCARLPTEWRPPVVTRQRNAGESAAITHWQAAVAPRKGRYSDFDAVVLAPDVHITFDMIELMSKSPFAADIACYLGKNKGEADKIAGMKYLDAAGAIGAIERKVILQSP